MKYRNVIALGIGFALDMVLGDPKGWPHPVRLIGKQIEFEEGLVRKYALDELDDAGDAWPLDRAKTEQMCGVALTADVALLAPIATWALLRACERFSPWLALAAESVVCYQMLATRSLRDESMAVYDALAATPTTSTKGNWRVRQSRRWPRTRRTASSPRCCSWGWAVRQPPCSTKP